MLLAMVFVLTSFAVAQTGLAHIVSNKDTALARLEAQTAKLERLLARASDRASQLERELLAATARNTELADENSTLRGTANANASELDKERSRIAALVAQLERYNTQISDLNAKLADAKTTITDKEASIGDLNAAINRLRQQLAELSKSLSDAESEAGARRVELSKLLLELEQRNRRIAELEPLAAYRSEFLQKMSDVFADNPNIRVLGDRFVFQSEVLFSSGSSNIGPEGRRELAKFASAFEQLLPRIPRDMDVIVQVQGHTDTDPIKQSGHFEDNWALSTARALDVVHFLSSLGIDEQLLSAAGFGEHQPAVRGDDPGAKAQNRRIEILITRR